MVWQMAFRKTNAKASLLAAVAVVALVASACGSSDDGSSAGKPDKVTLALAANTTTYGPYLTAIDRGFYKEQGVNINVVKASGAVAIPGLISGSVDFAAASSSATPSILRGYKVKILTATVDSPTYIILGQKSITSLQGLKGKTLGIQAKGDSTEIAANAYLASQGMKPSDVSNIAVGANEARAAALQKGAVGAVVLDVLGLQQLEVEGKAKDYQLLATIKGSVKLPIGGLVAADSLLSKNRDLVNRFLKATAEGENYYLNHRDYAINLLAKKNNQSTAAAAAGYDASGSWPVCGCVDDTAQQDVINLYAKQGNTKSVPISQAFDFSFAKTAFNGVIQGGTNGEIMMNKFPKTSVMQAR